MKLPGRMNGSSKVDSGAASLFGQSDTYQRSSKVRWSWQPGLMRMQVLPNCGLWLRTARDILFPSCHVAAAVSAQGSQGFVYYLPRNTPGAGGDELGV